MLLMTLTGTHTHTHTDTPKLVLLFGLRKYMLLVVLLQRKVRSMCSFHFRCVVINAFQSRYDRLMIDIIFSKIINLRQRILTRNSKTHTHTHTHGYCRRTKKEPNSY